MATLGLSFNLNRLKGILFRYIFLLLLFFLIFRSEKVFADYLPVEYIEIQGNYSISEDELLYLLDIKKGKPLDELSLRSGIKRAFKKGIFENIAVESLNQVRSHLKIVVEEKRIIDKINVKGNEYLSTRFIRKHLKIKKDDRLSDLKLHEAIEYLKKKVSEKGFIHAKIKPSLVFKPKNKVEVIVYIEEGQPEIIRKIKIEKDDEFLLSHIDLQEGDIFDRTKIERLREKFIQFYKKTGHIKTSLLFSYEDGTLILSPDKGKKLNISFDGNTALSTKKLSKEILFFEYNDFNYDLVEETISRIITLYHENGYSFAQVAPVINTTEDEIDVNFFIYEGDRYIVEKINFNGTERDLTLNKSLLENIISLKKGEIYNPDLLEQDKNTVDEFYSSLGYIYASVNEPFIKIEDNKVIITFFITEGPQIKISDIQFKNNINIPTEELLEAIPLKIDSPYNEVGISDAKKKILDLYFTRGFLDCSIEVKQVISEESASLIFDIKEGNVTYFGKDILIGNEQTNYRVIKREFLHEQDKPLNYNLVLKERHRLYRLGLFEDIETRLLDKEDNKRDILYKFKEEKAGAIEFGIGYADYEGLRGFFEISHRNLWGMNRQASFRTELSTLQERYIFSYFEPWFLSRDTALKSFILYEKRDEKNIDTGDIRYRIKRRSASIGIERKLSEVVKSELYYEFSVVKTTDVMPDIILSKEDTGTVIISGLRPGLIYDTRDNPFDPKKGILGGISLKFATSFLFSESDFLKLSLFVNNYQGLSKRFTLAISLRGGIAIGLGSTKELPLVERFFLGGRTTVRGYEQDMLGPKGVDGNPTGGNVFAMANLELRTDIGKGFGLVTFLDLGNVWQKIEDFNTDVKYTTGIGLRYHTPVGPLRVDYGHKLNRERRESTGELHFSIGHAF